MRQPYQYSLLAAITGTADSVLVTGPAGSWLMPPVYRVSCVREMPAREILKTVQCKEDVEMALRLHMVGADREMFVVILLNAKNDMIGINTVHIGTLSSSLVGPREVFKPAILLGAAAIIVAHNHPSGNPQPSPEDLEVTRKLVEVGNLLDIPVLDHVIIGLTRSVSLQAQGRMG